MSSRKLIKLLNKNKIFFSIILTIITIFLLKNFPKIHHKVNKIINTGKKILAIKKMPSPNCDFDYINKVPLNSSVIIGHLYGRVSKESVFIDKKAEQFLIANRSIIKNLFLTGDIFAIPTKEKWNSLFNIIGDKTKIIIAPGNHDLGNKKYKKIFYESIPQRLDFPFYIENLNNVFFIEDSYSNGWLINKQTIKEINNFNNEKKIFLLRHNIPSVELLPIANSRAGISSKIHDFTELNKLIKKEIIIISGDGGAFKFLPKFYCRKEGKITFITNGLGGFKRDEILIINKKQIYKYKLH